MRGHTLHTLRARPSNTRLTALHSDTPCKIQHQGDSRLPDKPRQCGLIRDQ